MTAVDHLEAATADRIVVGIDGSPSSTQALRWAVFMAAATASTVEAVTVWHLPSVSSAGAWAAVTPYWRPGEDARKMLEDVVKEALPEARPSSLRLTIREGATAKVLLEVSASARMLVVGSRGHGGFAGLLLGSVSTACSAHATCPVLVVHADSTMPWTTS
jgi:nucleotide-binding universal stress UspA family protein